MSTGNPLLDMVLVGLVFVWIFCWIYSLTSRTYARRDEQHLTPVRAPRSPVRAPSQRNRNARN